jgi:hypothetical protein
MLYSFSPGASSTRKKNSEIWPVFNRRRTSSSTTKTPPPHHKNTMQENAHFPKTPSKTPTNKQKKAPATAGTFSYKIKTKR